MDHPATKAWHQGAWHPSSVFRQIKDIPKNSPLILINRVSSRGQRFHLPAQIGQNVRDLALEGFSIQGIHSFIEPANTLQFLSKLISIRRNYSTPYFIAEHFDRFLRHPEFGPGRPYLIPTQEQLAHTHRMCQENDIILVSRWPINLSLEGLSSRRAGRGKWLRGSTTRMYQQNRRSVLLPIVKSMATKGYSVKEIADHLYMSRMGVWRWLKD